MRNEYSQDELPLVQTLEAHLEKIQRDKTPWSAGYRYGIHGKGGYDYRDLPPSQLFRELMSVNSMNPWDGYDSSSRKQMFASHIGQALVISGSTERRCQTGMEREYGKYTFSVKMPCRGEIIRYVDRYRQGYGENIPNPQTVVIFERTSDKQVGVINLTKFCTQHQYLGFEYVEREALSKIRPHGRVDEGEIFLDSPSVTKDGGYKYGVEVNMAFMSHPAASEDGILISRDFLKRFTIKTYETRVVEWGSKRMPLNLYGDEKNYKPFPDIGEYIRADGMLMALRDYDTDLAVVEQSVFDLMEVDHFFDRATYVAGPGGRVVDIRVFHDGQFVPTGAVNGMNVQPLKYDRARREFYQTILDEYKRLHRERGGQLNITPEFHRLVVEAISVVGCNTTSPNEQIRKIYRKAQLDEFRVEFVVEYTIEPTIGFKLTDCHGGKGVICHIAEPHEMPVDEAGNRADVIMDPNSTIGRMNLGRVFEQYINAASRDVSTRVRQKLGLQAGMSKLGALKALNVINAQEPRLIEEVWNYLMGYYEICSPRQYRMMTDGSYHDSWVDHLSHVVADGIYLYMPPENEPESKSIVSRIEYSPDGCYRPTYGPVTYIGYSGQPTVTRRPIRIGSLYMIMLEKIADDWTGVSSGKVQHFGVLSQVTNADKNTQPSRMQAIRAWGEAEIRIATSFAGPMVAAEILDRNNNMATHRHMLHNILEAEHPTALRNSVNRTVQPMGGSKPLQLVKHILQTSGCNFVYHHKVD